MEMPSDNGLGRPSADEWANAANGQLSPKLDLHPNPRPGRSRQRIPWTVFLAVIALATAVFVTYHAVPRDTAQSPVPNRQPTFAAAIAPTEILYPTYTAKPTPTQSPTSTMRPTPTYTMPAPTPTKTPPPATLDWFELAAERFASCNGHYTGEAMEKRRLAAKSAMIRGYHTLSTILEIVADRCLQHGG